MKKKAKILIVFNILFYIFIFIHKYYTNDDVPQVLFYMALSFSSIFLEATFKNKIKELEVYLLIDFLLRIGVLILHFTVLIFKIDISKVSLITAILFMFNTILEVIILEKVKNIREDKSEIVNQKDINKFIEDFKSRKLNYYAMGTDLKDEMAFMINALEISGKGTIVIIILSILVFISRFIYANFVKLMFIPILLIILLLHILFKLSHQTISIAYKNNEHKSMRNYIDIITFVIGYIILFCEETIFYGKMGYLHISILVAGAIFFVPIFSTKYIIKKKFEDIYKKYKSYV
ncbi:hypothetical protein KPL26_08145 [Clostridium algidicarnis]|uniref:hypothetical protein n=1 Tax=Clostridium algidicarnis TaxID=37659 RepID=UPI001C0C404E|nr:hypothetical protein [Clostridium algidicarnis]MBU3196644.1 hypothetical protein [Clostridium algidicarnis]